MKKKKKEEKMYKTSAIKRKGKKCAINMSRK